MRHFASGIDCAIAGAATAVEAASPAPADFRNSRRFIGVSPAVSRLSADITGAVLKRTFLVGRSPVSDWRQSYGTIRRSQSKKPGAEAPGFADFSGQRSGARARSDHEGVIGVFGH